MLDRPQSVVEHLSELRRRIIWAGIAVVIGIVAVMTVSHPLFIFLMSTAKDHLPKGVEVIMVQNHFSDSFLTEFRLAVIAGLVLASPVVLYQVVAFVLPALTAGEKRLLYIGLPFATGLFVVGWLFGWYVVIPITKGFFLGISSTAGIVNQITPTAYVDFVLGVTNPLGLAFELPLVVLILARIGLVTASLLSRIRKYAFLGIMVLAAVLSPPDVISMMVFLVPLYGLYEFSILMARIAGKRKE